MAACAIRQPRGHLDFVTINFLPTLNVLSAKGKGDKIWKAKVIPYVGSPHDLIFVKDFSAPLGPIVGSKLPPTLTANLGLSQSKADGTPCSLRPMVVRERQ
jgi:hypothetical protein